MSGFYTHDNATAPGIALAHTVYGEPVGTSRLAAGVGVGDTTIGQATWSTAPFKPRRRVGDNGGKLCAFEGCKAYPSKADKSDDYCSGHARSLGLTKTCAKRDCKAIPLRGEPYCSAHNRNPDAVRPKPNAKIPCAKGKCKSFAVTDETGQLAILDGLCQSHARQAGLLPTCRKEECGAAPQRGAGGWCYWHKPKVSDDHDAH